MLVQSPDEQVFLASGEQELCDQFSLFRNLFGFLTCGMLIMMTCFSDCNMLYFVSKGSNELMIQFPYFMISPPPFFFAVFLLSLHACGCMEGIFLIVF